MDSLITLLTDYGYIGMFISAFLAGSIFPLSSEVVMLALMAAGIPCGTEVEIRCDGADENEALTAAIDLIKSGLGE